MSLLASFADYGISGFYSAFLYVPIMFLIICLISKFDKKMLKNGLCYFFL